MSGPSGGIGGLPPIPPFDCMAPPTPPAGAEIDSVDSPQNYRVAIHGHGFLLAPVDGIYLAGTPFGDMTYYDSNGPRGALNPIGVTVMVSDTDITIDDVALGGSTINIVQLTDVDGNSVASATGQNVPVGGTPVDYPLLETIQSQAANSVTFTGQRFQSATAGEITHLYVRLASYATGCFEGPSMSVNLDGSPNLYGWVVDQFDDNTIRLTNPSFTDCEPDDASGQFIVNGVSFDAPNYGTPLGDGYYFYEPWGSMYSAPIQQAPSVLTPVVSDISSPFAKRINITGADFDDVDSVRFVGPPSVDQSYYDPAGPNAGFNDPSVSASFSPTFITILADGLEGVHVNDVHLRDASFTDLLETTDYDFTVPASPAMVTSVDAPVDGQFNLHGTNLTHAGMFDVKRFSNGGFQVYDPTLYPSLADPDLSIVTWTDTLVTVATAQKQLGQELVSVDVHDRALPTPSFGGSTYDFPAHVIIGGGGVPTVTAMSSPAINTIRIEGTNLQQFATFDIYTSNGPSDFAVYNTEFYGPSYDTGKTILTFTPTVFEFVMDGDNSGIIVTKADVYQNATYDPFATLVQTYDGPDFPIMGGATTPEIDSVTGTIGHFTVSGLRFVTSPDWVVNELEIGINATPDLPEALTLHAFDPSGPDAGTGDSAIAITSWADSAVEIDFTLTGGDIYVVTARAYNQDRSEHFDFTVTPSVLVQNV